MVMAVITVFAERPACSVQHTQQAALAVVAQGMSLLVIKLIAIFVVAECRIQHRRDRIIRDPGRAVGNARQLTRVLCGIGENCPLNRIVGKRGCGQSNVVQRIEVEQLADNFPWLRVDGMPRFSGQRAARTFVQGQAAASVIGKAL